MREIYWLFWLRCDQNPNSKPFILFRLCINRCLKLSRVALSSIKLISWTTTKNTETLKLPHTHTHNLRWCCQFIKIPFLSLLFAHIFTMMVQCLAAPCRVHVCIYFTILGSWWRIFSLFTINFEEEEEEKTHKPHTSGTCRILKWLQIIIAKFFSHTFEKIEYNVRWMVRSH